MESLKILALPRGGGPTLTMPIFLGGFDTVYMYTEANLKWQWTSKSDHFLPEKDKFSSNFARGTADPEIDFVTWTKFGNQTTWHKLH